jgi:hypothetical protein
MADDDCLGEFPPGATLSQLEAAELEQRRIDKIVFAFHAGASVTAHTAAYWRQQAAVLERRVQELEQELSDNKRAMKRARGRE